MLLKDHCAAGFPVIACAPTDNLVIASSTWLAANYNMYSLWLRYRFAGGDTSSATPSPFPPEMSESQLLQLAYFQTFDSDRPGNYSMSALWLYYIWGIPFDLYNLSVNVQLHYYFEEDAPFSLRRPRIEKDPTELVISTLHEVKLHGNWYMMGEVGLFSPFLRTYPLLHTGASLQWRPRSFLFQIGFSNTGTLDAYFSSANRRDFQFMANGDDHGLGSGAKRYIKYDYAVHPEFVAQYYF